MRSQMSQLSSQLAQARHALDSMTLQCDRDRANALMMMEELNDIVPIKKENEGLQEAVRLCRAKLLRAQEDKAHLLTQLTHAKSNMLSESASSESATRKFNSKLRESEMETQTLLDHAKHRWAEEKAHLHSRCKEQEHTITSLNLMITKMGESKDVIA